MRFDVFVNALMFILGAITALVGAQVVGPLLDLEPPACTMPKPPDASTKAKAAPDDVKRCYPSLADYAAVSDDLGKAMRRADSLKQQLDEAERLKKSDVAALLVLREGLHTAIGDNKRLKSENAKLGKEVDYAEGELKRRLKLDELGQCTAALRKKHVDLDACNDERRDLRKHFESRQKRD